MNTDYLVSLTRDKQSCVFRRKQTKKKALALNQLIFMPTQNRKRILLPKFSKFFKERRNRRFLLFSSLWSSVYIQKKKNFTELPLRKTQMLINIGHKIGDLDKYSR